MIRLDSLPCGADGVIFKTEQGARVLPVNSQKNQKHVYFIWTVALIKKNAAINQKFVL